MFDDLPIIEDNENDKSYFPEMSHWNYRVVAHTIESTSEVNPPIKWYGLYEVYYNEKKEPWMSSEKPEVTGFDIDEMIGSLEIMLSDLRKAKENVEGREILNEEDYPELFKKDE